MPRYDVTLDTDTTMKGTLVEVPPVGGIKNGETVENVYLTEEQADFLATNPHVKVKKRSEVKAGDAASKAEKAKTFEELDELALGEERDTVVAAITARRVALAETQAAQADETPTPIVEATTAGALAALNIPTTEGGDNK